VQERESQFGLSMPLQPEATEQIQIKKMNGERPYKNLRVPRAGLHNEAVTRLRNVIIRGDLAPGEKLNEMGLSAALGISRTPLREALKLLAAEGLVELRVNRSAVVAPFRRDELKDLFETVAGIERVAAELAAVRITERELKKLRVRQERMERHRERGELRGYFEVNQQVHKLIVAGAVNKIIIVTHDGLLARAERARFFALSYRSRWAESVDEHRAILEALERRDGELTGRLLASHVLRTGEVVSQALSEAVDEKTIDRSYQTTSRTLNKFRGS
jgi:DNA-binding GntR family transcriptional regulator